MSEENVEAVRKGLSAYARGDIDGFLESLDPDVVWDPAEEPPMTGREAVRAYLQRWESAWDKVEAKAEEIVDAGDRVLVTVRFKGRGRGSGIEVSARSHQVSTLRNGKTVRWEEFGERVSALEAAGLAG